MKIAEALVRMKDVKGKIAETQRTIQMDALFKKVDESQVIPNIEGVILSLGSLAQELSTLKTRVAKTNAKHGLVEKIYEMDKLKYMVSALESHAKSKQETTSLEYVSYGDKPVPLTTYATFDVSELAAKVEGMKTRIREVDMELQKLNWQIDLED